MSEQNPYIVREEEGKAATIRDFVTGIPLTPDEMLPDDHGIVPVSPLGFLNKTVTDGYGNQTVKKLDVHEPVKGFVPYKVEGLTVEQAYLESYIVTGKYSIFVGDAVAFPVLSISRVPNGNSLIVRIDGKIPTTENQALYFRNITVDDYTPTGLPMAADVATRNFSIDNSGENSVITISFYGAFSGVVGAGKLQLCIKMLPNTSTGRAKQFLCVSGNDTVETNGIFKIGITPNAEFLKMFDYGDVAPTEESCSFNLAVAYQSGASNYLGVVHTDGTVEDVFNECENTYEFRYDPGSAYNKFKVTYVNKRFTGVAMSDGKPLLSARCYFRSSNWGPYLSTVYRFDEDAGEMVYMSTTFGPGEPIEWNNAMHPESDPTEFVFQKCHGTTPPPFPEFVEENALFYWVSDAYSFENISSGPLDDMYIYVYNIEVTKGNSECYASNGYSDREVADWVREKLGPAIEYAKHPASEVNNIDSAGAFAKWFVSCGEVDVSGGMGSSNVNMPGFGLGKSYLGKCSVPNVDNELPEPEPESGRWLTFGYSTKHDSVDESTGNPALPMDWPFSAISTANGTVTTESENNITLVKNGVEVNGEPIGSLTKYDECEVCGGTGEVDSEPCPACCGTGYAKSGTTLNKVHVCLFNDFEPSDGTSGAQYDNTTILKKTFINLGTPLDSKDGDEFEITVSLPNVNVDKAFPANVSNEKSQSGYYAFISQPRVYVVSGTWQFSNTMVNVITDQSTDTTIEVDGKFLTQSGDELSNVHIRVAVTSSGYPSETTVVTGVVNGTTITLDRCQSISYEPGVKYTICGAAYLDNNNETLPAGSTPIGLNAVRREEGALGNDYGFGGGLQVYNRFYGAGEDDINHGRDMVIESSDKRQIVATVYPTVTNTFEWNLSGSKTLNNIDRVMTRMIEDGADSIVGRVAWMNNRILMGHPAFVYAARGTFSFTADEYPIDINKVHSPDGEQGYSYIGKVIQVAEPEYKIEDGHKVIINPSSNPVRQAGRAVGMLADDYRNARVRTGQVSLDYANDVFMKEARDVNSSWDNIFTEDDYNFTDRPYDQCNSEAQSIRLRNLAPVVSTTMSNANNTPISPILGLAPYVFFDGTTKTVAEYYAGNPHDYAYYESTDAIQEVKCDYVNNTYGRNYLGHNSIASACLQKAPSWLDTDEAKNDLFRAIELASIDVTTEVLDAYRVDWSSDWLMPFDAFARIISPDNIPVPIFGMPNYNAMSSEASTWYGGDAYHYYRILKGYDRGQGYSPTGMIATTMDNDGPALDSLVDFLMTYIPSYGADLPTRNWDSFRIKVKKTVDGNQADQQNPVYLTRMKWYGTSCGNKLRGKYAADAFIGSDSFDDVNLNRTWVETYTRNNSATPYALGSMFDSTKDSSCEPFNSQSDHHAVAYIRMFMKFTFSADAGRWYCTDYRQAPVSYLTPLYGAKALEEKIGTEPLWVASGCANLSWNEVAGRLYDEYQPLDINPNLVEEVMRVDGYRSRLMKPDAPVRAGGLGLNVTATKSGNETVPVSMDKCANFWNVREHLRPATGAMPGTDIPSYTVNPDTGEWEHGDADGIMSDAVLWGQYDYPKKRTVEYILPDVDDPPPPIAPLLVSATPNGNSLDIKPIGIGNTNGALTFADSPENP